MGGGRRDRGHRSNNSLRGKPRANSDRKPFHSGWSSPKLEGEEEPRASGMKHPAHLKGREIGLFYAQRSKENRMAREPQRAPLVTLSEQHVAEIRRLLEQQSAWQSRSRGLNDGFKDTFLDDLEANHRAHSAPRFHREKEVASLQDAVVDGLLQKNLMATKETKEFQALLAAKCQLPIWTRRYEIIEAVRKNQVVIICGETGCGKTTQTAQFLLDEAIESGKGSAFRAVCTQPRRIAAISVAQRVAQERCEPCGGEASSIGYQIRLERRLPRPKGSVLYCTTGILMQLLQSDPFLDNVTHLLLDEVHERDVETDFLLTIVRDLLPERPQLRVILMSATIDADVFAKYFDSCPVLTIPGLTHPVRTFYLEDVLCQLDYRIRPKYAKRFRGKQDSQSRKLDIEYTQLMVPFIEEMEANRAYPFHVLKSLRMRESEESPEDLVLELLKHICTRERGGAILIFFPGWEQISRLHKQLLADRTFSSRKYLILPLHSMLPTVNQRLVFDRPPPGVRKIILSTNIAETSITIDDVVFVIDCGQVKQSGYDPCKNLDVLQPEWISLANSRQRQGRAGRTQPGDCFRLYSRARESSFAHHPVPEMKRVRLEELILRIKILRLGRVEAFLRRVPEAPEERTVQLSLELLRSLGALDECERLTPLGFHLAQLPTDPRTGKLILLGAIFGCLEPVLSVAAVLSFKDPFVVPLHQEELVRNAKKRLATGLRSDHLLLAKVMREYRDARERGHPSAKAYCVQNYLSFSSMSMLSEMVDQFCRHLHDRKFLSTACVRDPTANVHSSDHRLILAVLCAGLFPNVAKVHSRPTLGAQRGQKPTRAPAKITTSDDGRVAIHPRSIHYDTREFNSPWICYFGKVKTTAIFLHDCSEVSPLSLMFFGGGTRTRTGAEERLCLARNIEFRSRAGTLELMESLRTNWDSYLSHRVSNPSPTDWSPSSADSALLRAIVKFVTAEPDRNSQEEYHWLPSRLERSAKVSRPEENRASSPPSSEHADSTDDEESAPNEDWEDIYREEGKQSDE